MGLGGFDELAELGDEAVGIVELGPVPGAGELDQAAFGDPRSRGAGVLDRDDRIVGAPDQQGGQPLGQIQAVGGADPLALEIDDRAQRVQERLARVAVGKRRVAARRLGEVRPGLEAKAARNPATAAPAPIAQSRTISGSTSSAPGSAAARSSGWTSLPSPPLETSTSRSVYSGNW